MAALGGIIGSFRAGVVDPCPNELNILLTCIAGAVIGGTSIFGGKGSILGSVLGIFCINLLQSLLGALGIGAWYKILLGLIIVVIVTGQALGWYQRERGT
jgi:ribose/xylose/arabinose/galactoside ABC-type transport system permease subunit